MARYLEERMGKHEEVTVELIDPSKLDLPMTDEDDSFAQQNLGFKTAIERADGLVIVVPEYNHSFPGSLKRALDVLYDEYAHKPVGLVGVSTGPFGGVRAVEALLPVARELGLSPVRESLYFSDARNLFDEQGNLKDKETWNRRVDDFLAELLWLAKGLKWGRENVKEQK